MKKIIVLSVLTSFLFMNSANAQEVTNLGPKEGLTTEGAVTSKKIDQRAKVLQSYLAKHNSPLQYYAQDFIEAADTYNLDWRLVASISGVESTFGKHVPGGHDPAFTTYNGWGWGVYGDNRLGFKSWRDGIFTVSQGLRERYVNRGLETPQEMNTIYASSQTWGVRVSYFMKDIDNFNKTYNSSQGINEKNLFFEYKDPAPTKADELDLQSDTLPSGKLVGKI